MRYHYNYLQDSADIKRALIGCVAVLYEDMITRAREHVTFGWLKLASLNCYKHKRDLKRTRKYVLAYEPLAGAETWCLFSVLRRVNVQLEKQNKKCTFSRPTNCYVYVL